MIMQLEQCQEEIPAGSMIKGSRPFYWILITEANLFRAGSMDEVLVELDTWKKGNGKKGLRVNLEMKSHNSIKRPFDFRCTRCLRHTTPLMLKER